MPVVGARGAGGAGGGAGGAGGLRFRRMRECLRAVDIEQLLLREEQGWAAEQPWEDVLSGGEQQRLCLARVLYHRPTFALLDECTSMVAADAEAKLYRVLFEDWGITPLMLTQRLYMTDLYKHQVNLGHHSADGWESASWDEVSPTGRK